MVTKNQLKRILSLHQKKNRKNLGLFFVEGEKVIRELLQANFQLEELFVTEDILSDQTNRYQISPADLKKISALTNPNNCLAVFRMPKSHPIDTSKIIVGLDAVRDPGNLGTIIRLCDWFGITDLICSEDSVDLYNPKVLQATMGSITRVNITYTHLEEFIKEYDGAVFGTFMNGMNIYQKSLPQKGLIILGNEANGISDSISQLISERISIPRFGNPTESLNVATATAVILSEFKRGLYLD